MSLALMRSPLAAAVALVLLAAPGPDAAAEPVRDAAPVGEAAAAAETGTVRGRILDTTCAGPCYEGMAPRPYLGEATVIARRVSTGKVAARIPSNEGRFHAQLPPGRYDLTAKIDGPYWESDTQRVRVQPGETVRTQLHVTNTAIL